MTLKAAIITSDGFGDGLVMLIAAQNLKALGYQVFVFNDYLISFQPWFDFIFKPHPISEEIFLDFDLCLLQYDNSLRAKKIKNLNHKNLFAFYPSYKREKHGVLSKNDFVFQDMIITKNIALGCQKLFNSSFSLNIGMNISPGLQHKKHKRVIIHPSSKDPNRNWPLKKYIKLSRKLNLLGFDSLFALGPKDKCFAKKLTNFIIYDNFTDLAKDIYESQFFIGNDSGPGHLASYLNIPLIIITNSIKRLRLWQPGWKKAFILTPPPFAINIKGFRVEKNWSFYITTSKILKTFNKYLCLI